MLILGINYSTNTEGKKVYTLHVSDDFDAYYNNPDAGRGCAGQKVESIFAGAYDCSLLKVGMQVEVLYDKAISTKKGLFQPVKKIISLNK